MNILQLTENEYIILENVKSICTYNDRIQINYNDDSIRTIQASFKDFDTIRKKVKIDLAKYI